MKAWTKKGRQLCHQKAKESEGRWQKLVALKWWQATIAELASKDVASLPVAKTGWQGIQLDPDPRLYSKDELVEKLGLKYVEWDGVYVLIFWVLS